MTTTKATVYRSKQCRCGCHGSDPWHRHSYKRTVTLHPVDVTIGTVRLPMSSEPVRVTRSDYGVHSSGRNVFGAWSFDPYDVVNDR